MRPGILTSNRFVVRLTGIRSSSLLSPSSCGGVLHLSHSPVRCAYRGYDCAVGAFSPRCAALTGATIVRWVRSLPGGAVLTGATIVRWVRSLPGGAALARAAVVRWGRSVPGGAVLTGATIVRWGRSVPGGAAVVQWVSVSSPDKASAPHPGDGRITPPRRIQLR